MKKNQHIIILEVENKTGVLNKIISLCRRRRYNIASLTVGTTHKPNISHITIVFYSIKDRIEQIVNQINKLVEVLSVEAVAPKDVIDKEMVLMIVKDNKVANKLLRKTTHDTSVRIINTVDKHPVLEIVGEGGEVEHLLADLDIKKEVVKMIRTGLAALKID